MFSVRLRFAVFALLVLGTPALLMGSHQPDLRDLGKLVMILSPALAGNLLAVGLARARFQTRPAAILRAAGVTLSIVLGATGVALALGAAGFAPTHASPRALAVAMAASGLTSILEELGWALGGLTLARAAFGERGGVFMLGGVWALWHLVPVHFRVGLFPDLEAGPPAMILSFIAACLVYRMLLTRLQAHAGSWLGAAAGHGAPNIVMAGLIAAGLGGWRSHWWAFPAPGGLIFLGLAVLALAWTGRRQIT